MPEAILLGMTHRERALLERVLTDLSWRICDDGNRPTQSESPWVVIIGSELDPTNPIDQERVAAILGSVDEPVCLAVGSPPPSPTPQATWPADAWLEDLASSHAIIDTIVRALHRRS